MRVTERGSPRAEVEGFIQRFPDLPPEAIVKEDLLRTGLAFSEDALRIVAGFKPKAYFIFSFDLIPIAQMQQEEHLRAPEEIALEGGPWGFRRTIVSVRVNPASPYRVELQEGALTLTLEGSPIAGVTCQRAPSYYARTARNGKPLHEIAPTIEWGYLIYLTVFRLCQYFGKHEECQFCDINENYRQQVQAGRPYTQVKTVAEVLEALEAIAATDTASRAYTVTGGSITSTLQGKAEVDFYAQYPAAIEEKFPGRWISKMVVQALPKDQLRKFKDAGVQIYHPNYEVWDRRLFDLICPGKARYIGRDEWIRRILDAATVFGPDKVIPNFVAGIEMSRPHGFATVEEAIASTAEGLEFFMARGVCPRFTTWCPEPLSLLGSTQGGAPLEYHSRLLQTWRDTHARHRLPVPPGYGPPGIGQAIFSVSAFMDVIRPTA
jgi:hypothetical protein